MAQLRISSGLNLHVFPLDDVFEYIRQGLLFHKSIGMDAADFPCRLISYFRDDVAGGIAKTKEIADQVGIHFELCHLPFGMNASSPETIAVFIERMHKAIDAMAQLGVSYAVLHPNTTTERQVKFDRQAQYDSVMGHLSPFVEHANRVGLHVVVENMRVVNEKYSVHRYCGDPEELCKIADDLGVGICWDTGHGHINGIKQSEALHYIGSRLKMLHINDNFGEGDIHIAPFTGTIDWQDTMKGLADIGYHGLLNFEVNAPRNAPAVREAFGNYIYAAAQELLKMM